MTADLPESDDASIDLYWLPLGAGGRSVRWNGRLFEALVSRRQHRPARDLYHSALEVRVDEERFAIEMTPAWGTSTADRGVVCGGSVGARVLGHSRFFRYEVRRWRGGSIPDLASAVGGPQRISADSGRARRLLALVPAVPTATWGRDELRTGDMWNSNSLTSWLLARSGYDMNPIQAPANGRAPGWLAGSVVAGRQQQTVPPAMDHSEWPAPRLTEARP